MRASTTAFVVVLASAGCHDLDALKPTIPEDASINDASIATPGPDAAPDVVDGAVVDASLGCPAGQFAQGDACAPPSNSCAPPLASTCGPNQSDYCCASDAVTGGTFDLGWDNGGAPPTPPGFQSSPLPQAFVSPYSLDRYEVTVGRFRQFMGAYDDWRSGGEPRQGDGANPNSPLRVVDGGSIGAWENSWAGISADVGASAADIIHDVENLCNQCGAAADSGTFTGTWTPTAGSNESMPMTCMNWYEAYMFCIWDGARLPTEAEWEFAAADGSKQLPYPWPGDGTSVSASQAIVGPGGAAMNVGSLVGGKGAFGQFDLAGNAYEWVMDAPADIGTYNGGQNSSNPIDLSGESNGERVLRGGSFDFPAIDARTSARSLQPSTCRYRDVGVRCARPAAQ